MRKTHNEFGKYVSPELVKLMKAPPNISDRSKLRQVEFVWLWLDDSLENYDERVSLLLTLGLKYGAFVENILPPVITFWFGAFPSDDNTAGLKDRFVEDLRKELKGGAKLYHGSVLARTGNVGSGTRFAFGVLTGRRSSLLADLAALDFGQFKEYENHGG